MFGMHMTSVRRWGFVSLAFAALAACSSGATTSGTTTTVVGADTTPVDSTSDSTADSSATSAAPTTIAATTTTVPEVLELRADGLGSYDFGRTVASVVDAVTAQLGAPSTNEIVNYTDTTDLASGGYYMDADGYAIAFPVGQTVCWTGDFCVEFGGASEADLHFMGWWYSGPPLLFTSSANLTIGSRQSDFPSMTVYPTCYTTGGGSHTGMTLVVETNISGWQWLVDDGTGNYVSNLPAPDTVRVTFMEAGARPYLPGLDC